MTRPLSLLYALGFVTFLLLGIMQTAYGPAMPLFRARYGLSTEVVSLLASLHFLGGAAGTLLSAWLLPWLGLKRMLLTAGGTLVVGALTLAFAPVWPLAMVGALVGGVGLGLFSSGFNLAFANLGARAPLLLNLLNAVYSVGVILAPIVVWALTGVRGAVWPFALIGAALLLVTLALTRAEAPPAAPPVRTAASRAGVPLFALLFLLYVAMEAGVATWVTAHLRATHTAAQAAFLASLFGVGFAAGRFVGAPVAARLPGRTLVPAVLVLATLTLLAARVPTLAPFAYPLVGLLIGPVFPTALAWFGQLYSTRAAPYLLTAGSLGGALIQPVVGWFVARDGAGVIPTVLSVNALLATAVVAWIWWATRPATPGDVADLRA
ncbi:MFS transporter [Deinococcus maricopensis]|uniref:MFS transporter n=1 Tax=Deinococcus maricopensis TaxID=309887 RepID=UPI000693C55D|nr:MFS transporter [Deinococcus maricopensis]